MKYESPCLTCTRVRDPKNCENKTCRDWQAWFIDRWEVMRENVRREMNTAQLQETGIPLGGHLYTHPDRVRSYLENDPCKSCPFGHCQTPCVVRKAWETQKGGAGK